MRASTGTEARVEELGCLRAQFITAEKSGRGMALKIVTGAKSFLKAYIMLTAL